jgi:maltose O-acetyltransferase
MLNQLRNVRALLYKKKFTGYLGRLKRRGLHIGNGTEILDPCFLDPDHCFLISIGEDCTLAPNVRLIAHDASTKFHLGFTRIGKITISDRCFIGDSVIVLPGVTIGPDSIIGAGAVVSRDIPGNSVAVGNPARVVCALDTYIEKIKERSKEKGVFDDRYLIQNISRRGVAEILQALEKGEGYIV